MGRAILVLLMTFLEPGSGVGQQQPRDFGRALCDPPGGLILPELRDNESGRLKSEKTIVYFD